jgi:hypothetical protein
VLSHGRQASIKELALSLSQELDREMVIAVDEQGGDAIFPTYLPTLAAILETVSITE